MKNQSPSLDLTHFPVMLNEVIKISSPSQGGKFIDCTFGGGGYSKQLLKFPKTLVRGLDRDKTVNIIAKKLENKFPNRFIFHQIKFSELDTVSSDLVDTVIFDLGLSSIQLNDFERGFSFKSSKNLDMSMGLSQISAQDAIVSYAQTKTNWSPFFDLLTTRWPVWELLSELACINTQRPCITRSGWKCFDMLTRRYVPCPHAAPKQ
jgi:16S rRNA C1402 N4-methylase RsmH